MNDHFSNDQLDSYLDVRIDYPIVKSVETRWIHSDLESSPTRILDDLLKHAAIRANLIDNGEAAKWFAENLTVNEYESWQNWLRKRKIVVTSI